MIAFLSSLGKETEEIIKKRAEKLLNSNLSLDEQIIEMALKRNPKRVTLEVDENGSVIIDKDKHPDIYDWAVNG
ncbi:MAG: hypothetical protein FWC16_13265 [Defluviitaleaceae bacterium]|nr:hypothetical protein [Defluviitaleaceae bacterium]MCL2275890.1 hypothetical protein [Defluviitaleaceae bacterium]